MSFLCRALTGGNRSLARRALTDGYGAEKLGDYVTDGVGLYRLLGAIASDMGQMVGLEDCRSLELILLPIQELHGRRLRPVIPSGTS